MHNALLDILVCPSCRGKLAHEAGAKELICCSERLAYAIQDGIPVMISRQVRRISLEEYKKFSKL